MFKKICIAVSIATMCVFTACATVDSPNIVDINEESLVVICETPKAVLTQTAKPLLTAEMKTAEALLTPEATIQVSTPKATEKPKETPKATNTPKPEYVVEDMESVKGYVNAGSVNLRKGPGTKYKVIAEYERWDKLKINGTCGEWYRVKIDGKTGFMLKELVKKGAVPTPTPEPTQKPTVKPTVKPTATPKATQKPSSKKYSDSEIYLVAQVVHLEGKGGTSEGYKAIAGVILNRVKSSSFPNTVEGVIFQKNQFTVARNEEKLRSKKPSSAIINAVEAVFNGGDNPLPSDVMYFRIASAGKSWGNREYHKTIDNNAFFR